MPLRPLRLAAAAAAFLAAGAATPAGVAGAQVYDLAISGIPIGTVTLRGEQSGKDYRATGKITPTALISALTSYSFDGVASGVVDGGGKVQPVRFSADSTSPRAARRTEIEWSGATPVKVSVVPPRKHAPDPNGVVGALDPVSASFALLRDAPVERICATSIDVFDGSRRSRLTLGEPVATGDGRFSCAGIYAQLEGEKQSFATEAEYPFTLIFGPGAGEMLQLERIETRTRFGPAVVTRRG
ncbi:DUF3108 domain-containing protein [Amaricoccus sp.]|uniref:DUF3108 domain-containing protein n=1 Tax=Amaricoccus sp. TaxID=1872485 RepID=UPI001B4CA39F|nr:DUF3108 domain-containing protein [Amaricoccus sp.]MBP7243341.1 DUF3108 domain-containing protein [Amaricoccus sp.]